MQRLLERQNQNLHVSADYLGAITDKVRLWNQTLYTAQISSEGTEVKICPSCNDSSMASYEAFYCLIMVLFFICI